MTTYSDPSQMNVHDDVLEQLLKLPPRELALELLRIAEDADTASTKNFLHYKFMPSDLILELGVHDLIDKGYTLPDDKREILVNMPFDDTMLAAQENVFLKGKKPKKTTDISDMTAFLQGIINETAPEPVAEEKPIPPRKLPFLKFDAELSHNVDGDGPAHRLIIGDNYHALAGMQASLTAHHRGVYDLIYIDPPYNTKSDQRQYRDAFPRTEWMSEQEPKLLLAKELLKDTGVIFISIDDKELCTLKSLCDSVFGDNNFIANIVVQNNPSGRQLDEFYATSNEYLLVYAKQVSKAAITTETSTTVRYSDFPVIDEDGNRLRYSPLRNTNHKFNPGNRPNLYYPLYGNPANGDVSVDPFEGSVEVYPLFGDGEDAVWRWSSSKANKQANELILRSVNSKKGGTRWDVFQKDYMGDSRTKKINTVWGSDVAGTTNGGMENMKSIIGPVFDSPKPLKLIKFILEQVSKDAKILDFFGGSGTTAEAVLLLNSQDGGTREVTIVTNDEKNIGTGITRERIVRAMSGDNWADGEDREGYGGRLVVHRLGVSEILDFDNCDSERKLHSWDRHAGEWGAWQDTPIPLVCSETHDVYTDGRGKHSIVFHNIDELRGTLVDEVLGEYPRAKVFIPFNKTNREAYIPDVPNSVMLPKGVVNTIRRGITNSVLQPYNTRSAKYMDSVLNMLSKKNSKSEEEKETD